MNICIGFMAVLWSVLLLAAPALASCTTYTVMGPDGTMQFCHSCCNDGHCQVMCF